MKCSGHSDYASGDVAKTGDTSALQGVFVVKQVLNRSWNWCKLEFTQMVFDSRIQIAWPMEYSI